MSTPEKYNAIEQQLFTWKGWDEHGPACFDFDQITLVVPIGPYPAGTELAMAQWDGERSILELYASAEDEKPSYRCKLKVTVEDL
jgi:hypothetical protein